MGTNDEVIFRKNSSIVSLSRKESLGAEMFFNAFILFQINFMGVSLLIVEQNFFQLVLFLYLRSNFV